MGPVIEARGLTHEYPDGTTALRDVTVTIEAGERVAVIGANGSGKSTLQHVLGGLVEPTAGTVEYVGETADAEAVRDRLGVLLQDPDDYLFNTTVREDIEYGPAQLGMSRQAATQRVAHLAAELGLESLLDRPPFRLSGGEKQRAAVASVLAFEPAVLLLDEPFGAVDAGYRERILELVTGHEGTVVLFTPSVDAVPEIADRVLVVGQDGSIAADGPVRDVLTDTTLLRDNGLRPPATVQLFEGILDVDDVPLTVSEARAHLLDQTR
ncbi:energy-coupling factor ABC transporter ATP-binding protein [Haloferax volcanii]|uniref:ATP-binding cassette domain-containing protein n=3 Tax=Haloferax volcanii TaxID=2246 RepID=A0A8T5CFY4_HALVO|nr:energy-coupling factor ABC transporter ATP-binding protein [Haloferax volcanii]ADE03181.1 ABC-type transport system ATP-binding protein (probable substrate nickel) [Haloferax volcanii DS2]ELY32847.1 putative cobalt ABC transporter ATP-binding protein [Haloferax volcanii DS2]MBS8120126.1 ATP-binding cassette domain-containing protein [Haloferax volcanii]MBS8125164.1 ATP-binding cassette domain-containing protein [Haloferax volcanii]MBS8129033.1 ATP-binding cassette domain-containing protein 